MKFRCDTCKHLFTQNNIVCIGGVRYGSEIFECMSYYKTQYSQPRKK